MTLTLLLFIVLVFNALYIFNFWIIPPQYGDAHHWNLKKNTFILRGAKIQQMLINGECGGFYHSMCIVPRILRIDEYLLIESSHMNTSISKYSSIRKIRGSNTFNWKIKKQPNLLTINKLGCLKFYYFLGERWVSNPRPSESQSDALTGWATISSLKLCGGAGIRTPGTLSGTAVFKTAVINRSTTPPFLFQYCNAFVIAGAKV